MPYFPPVQSINDFTPDKCLDILHRALGTVNLQIDVKAVKTWTMSAQVAEHFQVHQLTRTICSDTHVLTLLCSAVLLGYLPSGLRQPRAFTRYNTRHAGGPLRVPDKPAGLAKVVHVWVESNSCMHAAPPCGMLRACLLLCLQHIYTLFCVAPAQQDKEFVMQCCPVRKLSGTTLKLAKTDCRSAWYRWDLCCWLAMRPTDFHPLAPLG